VQRIYDVAADPNAPLRWLRTGGPPHSVIKKAAETDIRSSGGSASIRVLCLVDLPLTFRTAPDHPVL
jgi:hypothetical protein